MSSIRLPAVLRGLTTRRPIVPPAHIPSASHREVPVRHIGSIFAVALATTLLAADGAAQLVDFAKYPDFKGQWVRVGRPNNWLELAGPAPLTPKYQKIFDAIQADVQEGGAGNWPSTFCIPQGMPAM